ncbi:ArsR/SmtB family transcription factor [Hoeflea prorocentri]|uniref:Metalloregulator ArsR/SmtB family transcription factor n=1 Tax=Hoeflea prorocentri TaxID=1922333 RepID=A0A9X3UJG5_9HYPH|nr:metalloregulator ArsR/SmtB family transcription factor [Hoeflea prorocentri]MCY6379881.1 metalloregulator ArsR/SmtB family transcription factor [Hoeflea prorocentri]MDA5397681.1 metalloregulator ArsR/SmtB family transcription factor [Hoeflea prorocentri]
MLDNNRLSLDKTVDVLKAAGEPTRLRVLALLFGGELTVTDLTEILGQSQPRISRHLKLLAEAGLVERFQEGAWAYFRLTGDGLAHALTRNIVDSVSPSDALLARDAERLLAVKRARAERAQAYFSRNAAGWDQLRSLHISDEQVEKALVEMVGEQPFDSMLDLGTGTGRILQLFSALYRRGVGVDASRDMLAIARTNIDEAGIGHASVRQADILNLPLPRGSFDLISIHQVLHFLQHPEEAISEAARMLSPGGRMIIVDFAPHDFEYLRDEHAHMRLGFSADTVSGWLRDAGLTVENVVALTPQDKAEKGLTVSIWLARDPRLVIANEQTSQEGVA